MTKQYTKVDILQIIDAVTANVDDEYIAEVRVLARHKDYLTAHKVKQERKNVLVLFAHLRDHVVSLED